MIHQSMLYKFIYEQSMKAGVAPLHIAALTLKDILGFPNMFDLVEKSLGFVSAKATLGEAKITMEKKQKIARMYLSQKMVDLRNLLLAG